MMDENSILKEELEQLRKIIPLPPLQRGIAYARVIGH